MEKKEIPKGVIYGMLVGIVLILGVVAQIFLNIKFDNEVIARLEYNEATPTSYKVYYQENPFYTEEYIEEGKTYVTQYVDKITADFSYQVNYSDKLTSGTYEYYLKAKVIAYTPGNESDDLWTKEYKLSDVETVNFNNDSNYAINKSVDIDYKIYKEDFENYRALSGVSANAKLIIELVITNTGKYPNIDDFTYSAASKLEMPLSDATFKITKSSSVNDDTHKIIKLSEENDELVFTKIIGILLWILAIFAMIVLVVIYRNNVNKLTYYEKILKKILNTYDDIIVNVVSLPSLSDLSVVEVTTFDELLDAQNEVRLPINFKEDKKKKIAKFVLVKNNLAWVYTLKEGDIIEKKDA